MKTITKMTRELGGFEPTTKFLERFTELVRADARADLYKEMNDPLVEMGKKLVADEREACAKVCESLFDGGDDSCDEAERCAAAIRARGNT